MKTANDITKAYNEAYRKDNDLIFFLLGGTVSNFLEEQYKKAKERCLFDCFKSIPFSNSVRKGNYIIDFNYTENINIESLLHHDIVFELTQAALK